MRKSATAMFIMYVSIWLIVVGAIPDQASAMLITSSPSDAALSRTGDLQTIQTSLESKVVSQRLSDLGFTPSQVKERLASLNDEQIHQVAQNLDGVQPGGELILILAIIGAVVVVLAIIGLARQA
jgi:hypothetical protein